MGERQFFIYFIMNNRNTVLYIGMTNELTRRIGEHREGRVAGFTKKYGCMKLVYFERFATALDAIEREKQLKKWSRERKERLIATENAEFRDLWEGIRKHW